MTYKMISTTLFLLRYFDSVHCRASRPTLPPRDNVGFLLGGGGSEHDAYHSDTSSAEVKNAWSCTLASQYANKAFTGTHLHLLYCSPNVCIILTCVISTAYPDF